MNYNTLINNRSIIKETDQQIKQPENVQLELFMHQKTLVYRLGQLEQTGRIIVDEFTIVKTNLIIVSDLIGSGKTLSMLALIASQVPPKSPSISNTITETPFYSSYIIPINKPSYCNLIIVSHSLTHQWEDSIKLTTLKYYIINTRKQLNNFNFNTIPEYDVILISTTYIQEFSKHWLFIDEYKWNRIIIDEAHTIKNLPTNIQFYQQSNFIYLISATPEELICNNRSLVIKNLLGRDIYTSDRMIHLKIKASLCVQNENSFVQKSINLPAIQKKYIKCLTPIILSHFGDSLPTNALNLFNAGSPQEAIQVLNCQVDTTPNIIKSLTELYEKEIYNINTNIDCVTRLRISEEDKQTKTDKLIENRNKFEEKIKGITDRLKSINSEYCPICLDSFKTPVASVCCKNIFCMECILQCTKHKKLQCPFCRVQINPKTLHLIDDDNKLSPVPKPPTPTELTKLERLIDIVTNANNNQKFLICSNYDGSFTSIIDEFNKTNIKFAILNGTNTRIQNIISKFSTGELKIILLNSNNFGSGLNLEMTTDIIIYHKLSSGMEKQVIGRGQRLGRTSPLKVTYLTHKNEYADS